MGWPGVEIKRVLLLSRDQDLKLLLEDYLDKSGYSVIAPDSDLEALEHYRSAGFDAIIAEEHRLRDSPLATTPAPAPLLCLTEMGGPPPALPGERVHTLTKPVSLRALAAKLTAILGGE